MVYVGRVSGSVKPSGALAKVCLVRGPYRMTLIFDVRALRANLRSMTCNELVKIFLIINLVDDVA